ncbi:MAG: tetratricopeptide repeat protein [Phycisphaera sp.]|nr:tetratricopeptide repeat protein [Phycisphaera sp.]
MSANKIVMLIVVLALAYWAYMNFGTPEVKVEVDPYAKGKSMFDVSKYDEALAAYTQALKDKPDDKRAVESRFNVARCLEQLKRDSEAKAAYKAFAEKYPKHELADKARKRVEAYDLQNVK